MSSPGPSRRRPLTTVVLVAVVALAVAFVASIGPINPGDRPMNALVIAGLVIMAVFGWGIARLWPKARWGLYAVIGLVTIALAIIVIAIAQAGASVVQGGVPPVPPDTMDTRIGWFTDRFWTVVTPASVWAVLTAIPYGVGAWFAHGRTPRATPTP